MLRLFLIVICMMIAIPSIMNAEDCNKSEEWKVSEESNLNILKRGSISDKTTALEELNAGADKCPFTENIRDQIISLAESDQKKKEYLSAGEGGELYISQFIKALGNTRDPRAIPYLMKFYGTGTSVDLSFVKIGNAAIDPLIDKLRDDSPGYRSSAARTLSLFLKPNKELLLQEKERKKIEEALIKELRNPRNQNPQKSIQYHEIRSQERASVRRNIVIALGYLAETGDKEIIPIIKSLAEEDPYYLDMSMKKNYTGPKKRYTVREEANKILERLKEKGPTK